MRSTRSRTSSTAVPPEPTRTRVTAPASSCRSPTPSSAASSASRCRRRAATASPCASSRRTRRGVPSSRPGCQAIAAEEGQRVVCWRDVPVDPAHVGVTAGAAAPFVRQLIVAAGDAVADEQDAFERKLYVIRRRFELELGEDAIVPSFSSRTIVYKGMLTAPQLRGYYPDLSRRAHRDGARARPLTLLDEHLPELAARPPVPDDRAQRRDQHAAREHQLDAGAGVAARARSCSATTSGRCSRSCRRAAPTRPRFDNVLELLVLGGRSLPHAMMMMIPEATKGRRSSHRSCSASTPTTSA